MLPMPSPASVAAFFGLCGMVIVGLITTNASVIIIASTGFVGLAWALASTMPEGRRLRRQRLEFAWWLDHGTGVAAGSTIPGTPFDVRCYVRHRGRAWLDVAKLEPLLPEGVELIDHPTALRFEPRARTEFKLRLRAPAAGRVVLHGLSLTVRGPLGLFLTPLYFPNPLVIKVLPRAAAGRSPGAATSRSSTMDRSGRTMIRRRGGGTELHELRDFVSGDPFKSIAWKASARRGRLMVKEVEQEVQETRWIILDVSGSMRGGTIGERKLDFALETAASSARAALEAGDRVGLMAFDGRIVGHVPPGEGKVQRIRIYDALLALTELVDEDLTDIDDVQLVRLVARYIRQQDGIDFGRGKQSIDVAGLVSHVRRDLGSQHDHRVVASNATSRTLRFFCQVRGLPLPYRADPGEERKAAALATALQIAGGRSRVPTRILALTDFDSMLSPSTITSSVKLVRAHGHQLAFVLPHGAAFAPAPQTDLEKTLAEVYGRSEARRLRDAKAVLGRLGVPALIARAGDTPGLIAARASGARRAA